MLLYEKEFKKLTNMYKMCMKSAAFKFFTSYAD